MVWMSLQTDRQLGIIMFVRFKFKFIQQRGSQTETDYHLGLISSLEIAISNSDCDVDRIVFTTTTTTLLKPVTVVLDTLSLSRQFQSLFFSDSQKRMY